MVQLVVQMEPKVYSAVEKLGILESFLRFSTTIAPPRRVLVTMQSSCVFWSSDRYGLTCFWKWVNESQSF